jgi:hypothetical protein
MNLEQAIVTAGFIQFGILTAGLAMTQVLNWKIELKKIDNLSQHIIWTHGAYVWFTILAIALVSVYFPSELIHDKALGRAITSFVALFWGVRFFIQIFYFNAGSYLTKPALKLGYHSLTVCFAYFTFVYGWATVNG